MAIERARHVRLLALLWLALAAVPLAAQATVAPPAAAPARDFSYRLDPGGNPVFTQVLRWEADPNALAADGWVVYGSVFTAGGAYLYGYGTFPAPNGTSAFCDIAAGEQCPVWPGKPMTAHWGVSDPMDFDGSDEQKAKLFWDISLIIHRRIELMISLPVDALSRVALVGEMEKIGAR